MKLVFALVVALLVGCGPSAQQIKTAKATQYTAPPKSLLDVALQVTQRDYKIGQMDFDGLRFATVPQWYTADGGRISAHNDGNGDYVNAGGGDLQVAFIVHVREVDAKNVMVEVTPKTFQLISGSPQPRELSEDDPNLPGWVHGRVDSLALAIYEEAHKLYPAATAP